MLASVFDGFYFFCYVLEITLGIAECHGVLIERASLGLQQFLLGLSLLQLGLKTFEGLLKYLNLHLVSLGVFFDLRPLFSMALNEFQILAGDIVVVLFHLTEGSLVVLHEFIYVLVLALFNLMNLNLLAKFEFGFEVL